MSLDSIRELVARHPFHPFVIRASSGQSYIVADPGLLVLMKTKVFIAEPRSDRAATIPYLHIAAVEETGNGATRRGRRTPRR